MGTRQSIVAPQGSAITATKSAKLLAMAYSLFGSSHWDWRPGGYMYWVDFYTAVSAKVEKSFFGDPYPAPDYNYWEAKFVRVWACCLIPNCLGTYSYTFPHNFRCEHVIRQFLNLG